jgi:hypothetical protein
MSRGYIVIAQNNAEYDYLELTYALAMSLKATQKENAICVCVDEATKTKVTEKHRKVFDHIVDIPFGDPSIHHLWKIQNKWKYAHMSPFDETIILDSDVVFTGNVDHWWDYLSKKDVWTCTNVKTFRNEDALGDFYRKKFTELEMPNIYSNFTYFKKSERTFELFKMIEYVMEHWDRFYDKFLKGTGQTWASADLAYALAIKLMDMEEEVCDYDIKDMPTFVHMKSYIQNIEHSKIDSVWTNSITSDLNDDLSVFIGNFKQTLPVHYVEKEWMTPEKISKYERYLGL